jgi:S1-C subfamily serine protease
MIKVVNWTQEIVTELATASRPEFVAVRNPLADLPRGNIPRIGIRPQSYNEEDPVVLTSVTPEGPAEKAGVKAGDKIIEVNGKAVKNFPMYMVQMAAAKKGEPIELTLERDGTKVTVKVKPE